MKVKELKEYLKLYKDEQDVIIKGQSGIAWAVDVPRLMGHKLTDTKREVCKLVLK
jgi:hypothetical protein